MATTTTPYTAGGYTINVNEFWEGGDAVGSADFNRVETNISTLRSYMISISYAMPTITSTTNRTNASIVYLQDINRLESNLETLRASSFTPPGYGGTTTWTIGKGFDYTALNRIEKNIKDLFLAALAVFQSFVYCGTVNAGYVRGALGGI